MTNMLQVVNRDKAQRSRERLLPCERNGFHGGDRGNTCYINICNIYGGRRESETTKTTTTKEEKKKGEEAGLAARPPPHHTDHQKKHTHTHQLEAYPTAVPPGSRHMHATRETVSSYYKHTSEADRRITQTTYTLLFRQQQHHTTHAHTVGPTI